VRRRAENGTGRTDLAGIVRRVERNDWVVVFVSGGERYKLVRILFGSDGSYFVSCPYRDADRAHLAIVTVNYAKQEMRLPSTRQSLLRRRQMFGVRSSSHATPTDSSSSRGQESRLVGTKTGVQRVWV
jgi:hypothetical protein